MSACAFPIRSLRLGAAVACAVSLLAGCDFSGAEAAEKAAAQREADGKAVGSACRHAGRAIEDCYSLNPKAQRAAVFAGWREMDEYMRENKLEAVAPSLPAPEPKAEKAERKPDRSERAADKTAEKAPDKSADKPEPRAARVEKRAAAEPPAEAPTGKVDLPPKPRVIKREPS